MQLLINSFSQGFGERKTSYSFYLHFADANELEITANGEILGRLKQMTGFGALRDLERQVKVFVDSIVEGRQLLRLEDGGEIPKIDGRHFSVRDLLTRIPIQDWPFSHPTCCPCAFCDSHGES
jgi:hypothetical protein